MNELIIRRGEQKTISGLTPATALPKGTPVMIGGKDPDTGENTFVVAEDRCDGFLTRATRLTAGLTDEEQLFGFGLETPFQAGRPGSIEDASELEIEGPQTTAAEYLVGSGTGAVNTSTAEGALLSFTDGKFKAAVTGEFAQYRVIKQMTPLEAGDVRIYVREIPGYKVP